MLRIQNIGKASFHLSHKGVQKLYLDALSIDIKIEMALLQKPIEVENMLYMWKYIYHMVYIILCIYIY